MLGTYVHEYKSCVTTPVKSPNPITVLNASLVQQN